MSGPSSVDQQCIGALTAEVAMMKREVESMRGDVKEVRDAFLQAKGGRKMGFVIITAVGAIGGLIGSFGHWLITAR